MALVLEHECVDQRVTRLHHAVIDSQHWPWYEEVTRIVEPPAGIEPATY